MSHTLDELIKPLGPRISSVRPFTALSPLSSPVQPPAVIRSHGLVILATGLAVVVAMVWALQSGYSLVPAAPQGVVQPAAVPMVINACTDPTRGTPTPQVVSLKEVQAVVLPEIRTGYPPASGKPEIITLPPDISAMVPMTPVPSPLSRTVPLPPAKPVAKAKPTPRASVPELNP